jgi:hypothetical protein
MTSRNLEQHLLTLIETSIEDTCVPDAIAAHADKRAGKLVTKTDTEQLEAQLGIRVYLRRQYGMTHIAWAVGNVEKHSILLGHSESNVRWPTGDDLRKKEPAYFGARDERNAARKKLLAEHQARELVGQPSTSIVTRASAAIAKIREAQAELAKLVEYGEPLHVVYFAVEKLTKEG